MEKQINKGITLISLVVTIIILIILAGVSIYLISGSSGILGRATASVDAHNIATAKEEVEMQIEEYATEYYDTVYVNKTENSTTQKGDWIFKNYGNQEIKTKNYKFEIFPPEGKEKADAENPYVVVIFENRRLSKKVTGTLSVEGVLNWEEVEIALPNDKEENPGDLPENTPETDAGTEVALKDGWGQETVTYTNTKNGLEVTGLTKIATVYAISDGAGNTVPVPKGFYYVGGTLDDGVIISDNSDDKYDGEMDKTTHEYAPSLKGNQFVWIPCSANDYHKTTTFPKNAEYDKSTHDAELTQIEKYGGFYIGRYEAGTSNIQGINFEAITLKLNESSVANYTNVTSGNVTSKANEIPYYYADYTTAMEMSRRMYKNDTERNQYVNSGLVTGTMWDVMINVMNQKTECDLVESSNWGNYKKLGDNLLQITECRGKYCKINDVWNNSNNYTKENNETVLLSTGSSDLIQKMHLYDVAGNLWEWTDNVGYAQADCYVLRGGGFSNDNDRRAASFHNIANKSLNSSFYGFRVALYIK